MFAVMFVPTTYSAIRLFLLLMLFCITIVEKRGKISPEKIGFCFFAIYIGYEMISFLIGVATNSLGAIPSLKTSLFWPVIYFIVGSYIASKGVRTWLCRFMLIVEFIVCLYDVWYCISCITPVPFPSILKDINLNLSFNRYGIVYRFSTLHMVTHIFMIPFTMVLYFGNTIFSRKKLTVLVIMELIVLLFAGRVALQLGVVAVTALMYFVAPRKKSIKASMVIKDSILIIFLVLFACFVMRIMGFGIGNYINNITTKIYTSFSMTSRDQIRQLQSSALLNGWLDSPLVGHGLGSYTSSIIRDENKWAYEMTYHAMLFQQGIVGFIVFFAMQIYSISRIAKLYKIKILTLEDSYPWIAGLISILIASSVDPYFGKMGCLWMLYFPFAIAVFNREGDTMI